MRPKGAILFAFTYILSALLLCGCGQSGHKLTADNLKAFAGAPPELQQSWAQAQLAAGTNDYVQSIILLRAMLRKGLSPSQLEAVQNALSTYDSRLMKAAERGDAAAQKALETLNSPGHRSPAN